ncbi:hypothetical protein SH2C18_04500 [Clostridium sediminicola]|uniref:hypothetical protein n=1 Tax=Clostridium sediminicola TaxID=3114879 RepID=UPI0031F1FD88
MSTESKKLFKYIGIIFIAVLISYKLPHDSCSIVQYIIIPIKRNNCVITISRIIPIVLFIIGIRGILRLERFTFKSKILNFIVIVNILVPAMNLLIDVTRTNYHWLMRDGLNSMGIVDSEITLGRHNKELTMYFNIEVIDYSRSENEFKIRVQLPESLSKCTGKEFYVLDNLYKTYGNRSKQIISEHIVLSVDSDESVESLFDSQWYWEDTVYELYNNKESIEIIDHGF